MTDYHSIRALSGPAVGGDGAATATTSTSESIFGEIVSVALKPIHPDDTPLPVGSVATLIALGDDGFPDQTILNAVAITTDGVIVYPYHEPDTGYFARYFHDGRFSLMIDDTNADHEVEAKISFKR